MDVFAFGLMAGLIIGWALGRFFYYDDDRMPQRAAAAAASAPSSALSGGVDTAAASAAGFAVKNDEDLELIEGIGPKIAQLLRAGGVRNFSDLAGMSLEQVRAVLATGGPGFALARPDTWIEQARLAAAGDWQALRQLQDRLTGGVDRRAA